MMQPDPEVSVGGRNVNQVSADIGMPPAPFSLDEPARTDGTPVRVLPTAAGPRSRADSQGWFRRRPRQVVVVGAGENGQRVLQELLAQPGRYVVSGLFDDRKSRIASEILGIPVRGTIVELVEFARQELPDEIIVTISNASFDRLRDIFAKLVILPVDLRLTFETISPMFRLQSAGYLGKIPLLDICHRPLKGWKAGLKLVEDKSFAILALILFGPLMLLIALLVKLDSKGPVFFKQDRFGYNDRVIHVLKFRSMYASQGDRTGAQRTVRGDPRVTRVGRYLRAFSLDELPQIINVLRGDMSLVGPRAHAIVMQIDGRLYNETIEEYSARHRVRPGMTGLAQINGCRGEVSDVESAARRVRFDLDYIFRWSIWLDVSIIVKSVWVVLFERQNAF